ncbi:MAG TPA: hypothetical protein VI755_13780, partial [Anaerolineales bacterium]|nr:hypothetical protein [Anaerolineales bacterium]
AHPGRGVQGQATGGEQVGVIQQQLPRATFQPGVELRGVTGVPAIRIEVKSLLRNPAASR